MREGSQHCCVLTSSYGNSNTSWCNKQTVVNSDFKINSEIKILEYKKNPLWSSVYKFALLMLTLNMSTGSRRYIKRSWGIRLENFPYPKKHTGPEIQMRLSVQSLLLLLQRCISPVQIHFAARDCISTRPANYANMSGERSPFMSLYPVFMTSNNLSKYLQFLAFKMRKRSDIKSTLQSWY